MMSNTKTKPRIRRTPPKPSTPTEQPSAEALERARLALEDVLTDGERRSAARDDRRGK